MSGLIHHGNRWLGFEIVENFTDCSNLLALEVALFPFNPCSIYIHVYINTPSRRMVLLGSN